jgi:BirA family biotin operon repressor/biotin-[acetyl-CoA-carboxylase] ligase
MVVPGLRDLTPGPPPLVVARPRVAGSQYLLVRDRLTAGLDLARPLVCLAGSGHGFAGQSGRSWQAREGNLHLTVAVPCDLPAGPGSLVLNAVPAVAVLRALEALRPGDDAPPAGIKWVNDILIGGRKAAGVLTAARTRDGRVTAVVFGIGLNLAVAPRLGASVFTPGATSLRAAWGEEAPALPALLPPVLRELFAGVERLRAGDSGAVVAAYRAASVVTGRRVAIWPAATPDDPPAGAAPSATGVVTGIDADLSLRLAGRAGPVREGRLALLA